MIHADAMHLPKSAALNTRTTMTVLLSAMVHALAFAEFPLPLPLSFAKTGSPDAFLLHVHTKLDIEQCNRIKFMG